MPRDNVRLLDRAAVLLGLRVGGAVLVLVGLWMELGGSFAGHYGFGGILLVVGAIDLLVLPAMFARFWKPKP